MPSPQRQSRLYSVREHLTSHINQLKAEVDMMVDHPIMLPGNDYSYFRDIEDKLDEMHSYEGMLTVLEKYFES